MKIFKQTLTWVTAIMLVVGSLGCTSQPTVQSGPDAEVSFDGLHKVDNTRVDAAWAVPSLNLSRYTNIMPISGGIEFREVSQRPGTSSRSGSGPYFIDDKARADFEVLVDQIFTEELAKSNRFNVVDEPGPDTLLVGGGLLDVVSYVPPRPGAGRSRIFLSSVGEATLVLEVRDSETNKVLARAIDRRAAEAHGGVAIEANTAQTTAEVRRLIRFWGSRLREALEGFTR